tara:strand:- start:534 stop:974 length:441 start_codon:yes stop_codon:yes gene_type:complete
MQKIVLAILFGLVLGLLIRPIQPQQASGNEQTNLQQQTKSDSETEEPIQIRMDLESKENLRHLEEDLASCRLFRVHLELSKLTQKYPHTKSGKQARRLLEGAGMRVIDFPMKTSDNCYRNGVPDYRYSYGIYSSIPEHVREGIILY